MTTTALTTPHAPQDRRRISIAQVLGLAASLVAFALVAAPGASAEACPNEQLRIEDRSTQLPDCRAYEKVSPDEKSGGMGDVLFYGLGTQGRQPMQATPAPALEGDAMLYAGEQFYLPATGFSTEYRSLRGAAGWETINLTPRGHHEQYELILASRDLSGYLVSLQPQANEPSEYRNLYLDSASNGSLEPLIVNVTHQRSPEEFGYASEGSAGRFRFALASSNLSSAFFAANDALLPPSDPLAGELKGDVDSEILAGEDEDYLYGWRDGSLHLESILPDGTVARRAVFGYDYGELVAQEHAPDLEHAVSEDGQRVFWTDGETGTLYVREDGERTREIAAGGEFLGATPNGSRVFYSKEEALYDYDLESDATSVVASEGIAPDTGTGTAGEYDGLIGTGGDGEYVYFISQGALVGGTNEYGETPVPGDYNMFVYEPSGTGEHVLKFIASLSNTDNEPSSAISSNGTQQLADWARTVGDRTSEVSPDGKFVAFGSHRPLTGVVNAGPQVFVFDAGTDELACASCDPSGVSNAGTFLPPFIDTYGLHEQRYMLDDGSLFFTTPSRLVSEDTNDVDDVYEFKAGVLSLISPGNSEFPAVLADASESGSDVFFTTGQPLVTQDQDGINDMYDARVDGGLPVLAAPSEACGTLEACRGAKGSAPTLEAPSSTTFSGVGNLISPAALTTTATVKRKTAAQLKSEKLARALKVCHRKPKRRRASCEQQARKRYGAKTKSNKRGH